MAKKELVLRLLREDPVMGAGEIARRVGVSREYVRILAEQLEGPGALRKRALLRAARAVLERAKQRTPERLSGLPDHVRRVLESLGVRYMLRRPAVAVLGSGLPVQIIKITRHRTSRAHVHLRILPPRLRSGWVLYYDEQSCFLVPAQEAPADTVYVREGDPLPLEDHRCADEGGTEGKGPDRTDLTAA